MKSIVIHSKGRLEGSLKIQGSKNSALPIMAASVLNSGFTIIKNCPRIKDVDCMALLLTDIGCKVFWQNDMLIIDAKDVNKTVINQELSSMIRASVSLVGALLGRFGEVSANLPGGCKIGKRPIDLHLKMFEGLGASVFLREDEIKIHAAKLSGGNLKLSFPSVGATENALLCAVLADGITVIENAAMEPEVVELCNALINMGADISGAGTRTITINGVSELYDSVYEVLPDRIVLGTYMAATAMTKGNVEFTNCGITLTKGYLDVMCGMGLTNYMGMTEGVRPKQKIRSKMESDIMAVNMLRTEPYPGFPTDMQPIVMSALCVANGKSIIEENIFENRFLLVDELKKMGADIVVEKNRARINGVSSLVGCEVKATDLRAGAALVNAGLIADGKTVIMDVDYILRGYEDIVRDYSLLGADIEWKQD